MGEAEKAIRQASERTALVVQVVPIDDKSDTPTWAAVYKGLAYDTITLDGALGVAAALMKGKTGFLAAPGWRLA